MWHDRGILNDLFGYDHPRAIYIPEHYELTHNPVDDDWIAALSSAITNMPSLEVVHIERLDVSTAMLEKLATTHPDILFQDHKGTAVQITK